MERPRQDADAAGAGWLPDQDRLLVDALLDLFEANRREGEAYAQCFQRVGAPRYAAYLADLLRDAPSGAWGARLSRAPELAARAT